jgi:hypothetical protein
MTPTELQQCFKFGNAVISEASEDFREGFHNGCLWYSPQEGTQEHPVSVQQLHDLVTTAMTDQVESSDWNLGFLIGAVVDLHRGALFVPDPRAPQVQLGTQTLHLDHWQFQDGFFAGIEDYHRLCTEGEVKPPLTARELLHYVAVYHSDTDRFYLDEEGLRCQEETLGQLAGFLCAALFHLPVVSRTPSAREPSDEQQSA